MSSINIVCNSKQYILVLDNRSLRHHSSILKDILPYTIRRMMITNNISIMRIVTTYPSYKIELVPVEDMYIYFDKITFSRKIASYPYKSHLGKIYNLVVDSDDGTEILFITLRNYGVTAKDTVNWDTLTSKYSTTTIRFGCYSSSISSNVSRDIVCDTGTKQSVENIVYEQLFSPSIFINQKSTELVDKESISKLLDSVYFDVHNCSDNSVESLYNTLIKIQNKVRIPRLKNKIDELSVRIADVQITDKVSTGVGQMLLEYSKNSKIVGDSKSVSKMSKRVSSNMYIIDEIVKPYKVPKLQMTDIRRSTEFYNSIITLSNWYEELENGGAVGLLIKMRTSKLTKQGVYNMVGIDSITTTFFPVTDYISATIDYFKKEDCTFGDLNDVTLLEGNSIGDSNAVIPLYINKYHWQISKRYIKPVLGIMVAHHPLGYTEKHTESLFSVLIDMTVRSFAEGSSSERWVQCYMAVLRTCSEICFENRYTYGIKGFVKKYMSDVSKRVIKILKCYEYEYMLGQILSTGYNLDKPTKDRLMRQILEEVVRKSVDELGYTPEHIEDKDSRECITKSVLEYIRYHIRILSSFYIMSGITDELYRKVGSYSKFIKMLEENYGCTPDTLVEMMNKRIKQSDSSTETFLTTVNIDETDIEKYISNSIRHTKNKDLLKGVKNGTYQPIN